MSSDKAGGGGAGVPLLIAALVIIIGWALIQRQAERVPAPSPAVTSTTEERK